MFTCDEHLTIYCNDKDITSMPVKIVIEGLGEATVKTVWSEYGNTFIDLVFPKIRIGSVEVTDWSVCCPLVNLYPGPEPITD